MRIEYSILAFLWKDRRMAYRDVRLTSSDSSSSVEPSLYKSPSSR